MISKEKLPAADAFGASIELNPDHRWAGAMHWLISNCYENLKRSEEADATIEWGYQTLFDAYPNDRDVAYAAVQLGRISGKFRAQQKPRPKTGLLPSAGVFMVG